uniref:Uncharacterized protein n=1 Tax=Meloidogyne enterolobii TaxID=390850 RepID=A0A6V7Y7U3_MELEN|nr:unnamed protein product [Meloidogyne enterolobii]
MSLAAVLYEKNYLASEGLINSNGRRHSRAVAGNVPRKLSYNEEVNNTGTECSLAEHLKLSCYQLQILQQSWPRIKSQGALLTVFRDLTLNNSSAREMFQKMSIVEGFLSGKCCDQKEHLRVLIELIDYLMQNLNGPVRCCQQKCQQIGEKHFIIFGGSLNKSEPVRGKREAFKAWITLTTFLVSLLCHQKNFFKLFLG